MLRTVVVGLIRFYRRAVSPWTPAACRFQPTCSAYALEAVERHGVGRGTTLAVRRLLRCHPWGGAGYDPVPSVGADGTGDPSRRDPSPPTGSPEGAAPEGGAAGNEIGVRTRPDSEGEGRAGATADESRMTRPTQNP